MTVARLLLDEMLSGRIAEQVRARGHDAVAIVERPDAISLPDDEVLALGTGEGRVVVTLNIADLVLLDAAWTSQSRSHAGLLLLGTATFPQDRTFVGAVVTALDAAARRTLLPGPGEMRFLARP